MKKIILLFLAIAVLVSGGCVERRSNNGNSQENYVVFNVNKLPDDLLMMNIRDDSSKDLLYALFEGLVTSDEKGKIVPSIAESWKVSDDGIEYRFKISEDAFWSDGTEITAGDFVEFFSSVLNADTKNIFDYQLFSIYGAQDYRQKKGKFDKVAIRAENKKELVIRLNNPCPDLLNILSQPIYGLRSNFSNLKDYRNKYKDIKFSGPFVISEVKSNGDIILEKNSCYKNREDVTSQRFLVTSKESPEAAFVDFEMNKVNIIQNPPFSEIKNIINDENTIIAITPNIVGLTFNFGEKSVGRDLNFRKGITSVLDIDELVDNALPEFSISAGSFLNSEATTNIFRDNAFNTKVDRTSAKKYLDNMKTSKPKGIKLIGLNSDINKKVSRAVADQIKKNLEINVQYKLCSDTELEELIQNGSYDLLLTDYRKDYNSDVSIIEKWTTTSRENTVKYSNQSFDNTFEKFRFEGDKDKRKKYLNDCQNILKEDAAVIYLFNDAKVIVKSAWLKDLSVNSLGNIDLTGVYRSDSVN